MPFMFVIINRPTSISIIITLPSFSALFLLTDFTFYFLFTYLFIILPFSVLVFKKLRHMRLARDVIVCSDSILLLRSQLSSGMSVTLPMP